MVRKKKRNWIMISEGGKEENKKGENGRKRRRSKGRK